MTTVTSKGQVTIPKAVRDLLGIVPGSNVEFRRANDGSVVLSRRDLSLIHISEPTRPY